MPTSPLKARREAAGLTQTELAARAGVSRQLVGAVEAGRHLPRVDAALALAAALDADVERLFAPLAVPVDVVSGAVPDDGALLRVGRVGDLLVSAPARVGLDGWGVADGAMEGAAWSGFGRRAAGLVVVGCEPGLEVLEQLLRERGRGAVADAASSVAALASLAAGRVHAAVVHGPGGGGFRAPEGVAVERFRLTRWRVGLAAPHDSARGWWREALAGRRPVVQRESGAGVQRAFARAAAPRALGAGPETGAAAGARTHLEAARRAVAEGLTAVTIEPAALAVGAAFHPLEDHEAELWVDRRWLSDVEVVDALQAISGRPFRRRLEGVGGYDLAGCGSRIG